MGLVATKYDIGDKVIITIPSLQAEVQAITFTGFSVTYRCVYWQQGVAFIYDAYDYELEMGENK